MQDLMHINCWETRVAFQKRLEEEGKVSKDQVKINPLEDNTWAIDIYDPELYACETGLYSSEKEAKEDYDSLMNLCNDDKLYHIPCSWQMYGYTPVRASNLEEAVSITQGDTPLPTNGTYVDGSFEIDHDIMEDQYMCSECGLVEAEEESDNCTMCNQEIERRDEKNGLYPEKEDCAN